MITLTNLELPSVISELNAAELDRVQGGRGPNAIAIQTAHDTIARQGGIWSGDSASSNPALVGMADAFQQTEDPVLARTITRVTSEIRSGNPVVVQGIVA
jgi:hypothetical protein